MSQTYKEALAAFDCVGLEKLPQHSGHPDKNYFKRCRHHLSTRRKFCYHDVLKRPHTVPSKSRESHEKRQLADPQDIASAHVDMWSDEL